MMNKVICFCLISSISCNGVHCLNFSDYTRNPINFDIKVDLPLYSVDCKKHDPSLGAKYYLSDIKMETLYQLDDKGRLNRFDKYAEAAKLYPDFAEMLKKHNEGFYRKKIDESFDYDSFETESTFFEYLKKVLDETFGDDASNDQTNHVLPCNTSVADNKNSDSDDDSLQYRIWEFFNPTYSSDDELDDDSEDMYYEYVGDGYYEIPLDKLANITVNGGQNIDDVKMPIITHTYNHNMPHGYERLTIPRDVAEIGDYAFSDMIINNITIRNGVERICKYAFYSTTGLYQLDLPPSIVEIEESAFQNCNLNTLTLYKDVMAIGNNAFDNCYKLEYVVVYYRGMDSEQDRVTKLLRDAGVKCRINFKPKASIKLY